MIFSDINRVGYLDERGKCEDYFFKNVLNTLSYSKKQGTFDNFIFSQDIIIVQSCISVQSGLLDQFLIMRKAQRTSIVVCTYYFNESKNLEYSKD